MNIPGFAAEFSLYSTSSPHLMMAGEQSVAGQVIPQFGCGACECDSNECCYFQPGPGGSCACLPRGRNGRCPGSPIPPRFGGIL